MNHQVAEMMKIVDCIKSVSYTHLDVYKRQNEDKTEGMEIWGKSIIDELGK